jgi:hypothetical protein
MIGGNDEREILSQVRYSLRADGSTVTLIPDASLKVMLRAIDREMQRRCDLAPRRSWRKTAVVGAATGVGVLLTTPAGWPLVLVGAIVVHNCFEEVERRLRGFALHHDIAHILIASDDPRAIPALLDIADATRDVRYPASTRADAEQALVRLLPVLGGGDMRRLPARHRKALRLLLEEQPPFTPERKQLLLAVLLALGRIGDTDCLPRMRRIAESSTDVDLRDAAAAFLPRLEFLATPEADRQPLWIGVVDPDMGRRR